MNSWHSYPSIYNFGHRAVSDILRGDVLVEEKVDGSQFSFGVTKEGEIKVRSRGQELVVDAPEKMFAAAVKTVKELAPILRTGWTYRGEYFQKPKHNTLAYSRIPEKHIILFDINTDQEAYLSRPDKEAEANRIGLEIVPLLFVGRVEGADHLLSLLDRESVLGGVKIEGVVVKPVDYSLFGQDKKALLAKFVSADFKEKHQKEWKTSNPTHSDVVLCLAESLRTEARWRKAVQHLSEAGNLTDTPKDIASLIKEVHSDVVTECKEEIMRDLWKHAWPVIQRKITAGLPEWYKEELMKKSFEEAA